MRKFIFGIIAFCGLFVLANSAQAQNFKVGVVDVQTIAKEVPESVEAEKKLMDLTKKYQDTLMQMQADLKARYDQYMKQKSMMQEAEQKKEEEAITNLQVQLQQYQAQIADPQQGIIALKREELLAPIRKKVKAAIDKVAKQEKLSMVVDKSSTFLLYVDEKYDITFRVLDLIKRGN